MKGPPDAIVAAPAKVAATEDCQTAISEVKLADDASGVNTHTRAIRLTCCRHCQHKTNPAGGGGTPQHIGETADPTRTRATLPRDYRDYANDILDECEKTFWDDDWLDEREQLGARLAPYAIWPGVYPFGIGFARVRFHGETFDLDNDGVPALLLGVPDECGDVVDLFAAELGAGNRVATLGLKSWCLGEPNIPFSNSMGGALLVHETLWEWLASGGVGIFITNYRRAVRRLDDYCIQRIAVRSDEFGERLDALFRASLPVPQILVEVAAS